LKRKTLYDLSLLLDRELDLLEYLLYDIFERFNILEKPLTVIYFWVTFSYLFFSLISADFLFRGGVG
jgi:hypothetical protein